MNKLEDIKDNCLVIFKRDNDYYKVFITDAVNNCLFFDTLSGTEMYHISQLKDNNIEVVKIIDLSKEIKL